MPARLVVCLLLLMVMLPHEVAAKDLPLGVPVEKTVSVRLRPLSGPVYRNHGVRPLLTAGAHEIGGITFTVTTPEKRRPFVTWTTEGKDRKETLSKAKGHRLLMQGKPKRTLFVFRDGLGRWLYAPGEGLRFEIRGIRFEMIDADHDGVWFETDVDLIRRVGDDHAVPLREHHVVEDYTIACGAYDATKGTLDVTLAAIDPDLNDVEREALITLNRERERMGLLGTVSVPEFARPGRKHADWMALHGKVQHHEEPNTKLYSAEGHAAGSASVIYTHPRDVDIATYVDIDSPIHGHVLTMPEFVRTGVGGARSKQKVVYGGIWTMELSGFKHARVETCRFPAVWPPHMATNVPRSWTTEGEDPRQPPDRKREQGYPIRVYLSPGVEETAKIEDLKITLRVQGKKSEPLDCFVIGPGLELGYEPSPYLRHLLGVLKPIFVLPRKVLAADTWHVLRLECKLEGKPFRYESVFRTGGLRGQYRDLKVGDKSIGR